jgi:Caspase domain
MATSGYFPSWKLAARAALVLFFVNLLVGRAIADPSDHDANDARRNGELSKLLPTSRPDAFIGPPQVEILDPHQEMVQIDSSQLSLTYLVRYSGPAPIKLSLYFDGERVELKDNQQPRHEEHEFIDSVKFDVPSKDVLVWLVVESVLGSTRASLHVRWVAQPDDVKPNLYVLAVGVKDYDDPAIKNMANPLQFSAVDAIDFSKLMKNQEGGIYAHVETKTLTEKTAKKIEILQDLVWLRKSVTNKDVAMIFLSGHGAIRDDAGYDYLPVEADKSNPELTYLHDFELKEYIKKIPAKIIAFIDTCHSGYFFQPVGAKALTGPFVKTFAVELAKSASFIAVYASSTGEELSVERDDWGHGAFTMAVLEGFAGKAINPKGGISLARLNEYIAERVKELTDGHQHPMYITPFGNTNPVIGTAGN